MPEPCVNDEESQAEKKERRNKRSSSKSTMPWPRWPPPPPPLNNTTPAETAPAASPPPLPPSADPLRARPLPLRSGSGRRRRPRQAPQDDSQGPASGRRPAEGLDRRVHRAPPRVSPRGPRRRDAAPGGRRGPERGDDGRESDAAAQGRVRRALGSKQAASESGAAPGTGDGDGETPAFKAATQVNFSFSLSFLVFHLFFSYICRG